jgi:hypothetical protein
VTTAELAPTPQSWRGLRQLMTARRHELTGVAGGLYPGLARVGTTGLLCREEWLPSAPLPLSRLRLRWAAPAPPPAVDGTGPGSAHVRPVRPGGGRYPTYAEAIAAIDPPALLENRACYRLLSAGLTTSPALSMADCLYFDQVNVSHAVAHELAAAWSATDGHVTWDGLPLRALAGDPCDLPRRPAVPAITTLTLRREAGGAATFLMHWRDPAKVNNAGGLYQVMPVGIFQPLAATPAALRNDFSLWRCMAREFSEELLGSSEEYLTAGGVFDYQGWPFCQRLERARASGALSVYCLGMGVDPLTFATDILTVAVFGAQEFDEVFAGLVATNSEGRVLTEAGSAAIPFTSGTVARFGGGTEPVQAAGAAVLQLAWKHRRHLLG